MKERPILFSVPMVRALLEDRKMMTRRIVKPQPSDEWTPASYGDVHKMRDGEFVMKSDAPVLIGWGPSNRDGDEAFPCPYGQPGDRLWVRESHFQYGHWEPVPGVRTKTGRQKWKFVADLGEVRYEHNAPEVYRRGMVKESPGVSAWHQRLARFMPRKYSRLTLEITEIRVERLLDISNEDAINEGVDGTLGARGEEDWNIGEIHEWLQTRRMRDTGKLLSLTEERALFPIARFLSLWASINGSESVSSNPRVWVVSFKRVEA